MAVTNLMNNTRRAHSIKVLARGNKPFPHKTSENKSLSHQYKIIRKDVLKLRNDLALGYDLLKRWLVGLRRKSTTNE
jgi:hypothetical protein